METAEVKIVKWCLNHEPQNRPFADELLKVKFFGFLFN